jgi:hypothetical protein
MLKPCSETKEKSTCSSQGRWLRIMCVNAHMYVNNQRICMKHDKKLYISVKRTQSKRIISMGKVWIMYQRKRRVIDQAWKKLIGMGQGRKDEKSQDT